MEPTISAQNSPQVQSVPLSVLSQSKSPVVNDSMVQNKAGFVFRLAALVLDMVIFSLTGFIFGAVAAILKIPANYLSFLTLITSVLYFWLLTGMVGATLGKRFFNIYVVTKDGRPTLGAVFLREIIGKTFSAIPLCLGFLWVLWDKDKQGWHDKIARTFVIQKEEIGAGKKILGYVLALALPILMFLGVLGSIVLAAINPQAQIEKARQIQSQQQQYNGR